MKNFNIPTVQGWSLTSKLTFVPGVKYTLASSVLEGFDFVELSKLSSAFKSAKTEASTNKAGQALFVILAPTANKDGKVLLNSIDGSTFTYVPVQLFIDKLLSKSLVKKTVDNRFVIEFQAMQPYAVEGGAL